MNVFDVTSMGAAIVIVGTITMVLLAGASYFSSAIVQFRSRSLPPGVCDRLAEEWLAELSEVRGRWARLSFALGILFLRNRSLESDVVAPVLLPVPAWEQTPYADRSDRVFAFLIDQVVVIVAAVPFFWLTDRFGPVGTFVSTVVFNLGMYLFLYIYCVLRFGGSPGKILLKLRIVPHDGGSLTLGQALIRTAPMLAFLLVNYTAALTHLVVVGPNALTDVSLAQAAAAGPARPVLDLLTIVFCIYGTIDLGAFLLTSPPRSLRDIMAGTAVTLRVPAAIEVPADLPPTRSTSMFR